MRFVPAEILGLICIVFAFGSTWMAFLDADFREKYYGYMVSSAIGALIGLAMPRDSNGDSP